jgi:capsular exopolysaccharide synthesis family protein
MNQPKPMPEDPAPATGQALVPTPSRPVPRPGGTVVSAARAARPAAGLDVRGLLRAFARRWVLAVTLGLLLGGAGAAAVWFFLPPPTATASALLHVQALPSKLAFDLGERPGDFQNTQVTLAKSRLVLNAALSSPKLASLPLLREEPDSVEWLEQNLKVAFVGSPEIMQVSLASAGHAEDLPVVVDVVADSYLEQVVDREKAEHRRSLAQLREIARLYEDKIKGIRSGLRALQEKVGSTGDKNMLALRQETAQLEYQQAAAELVRLRSELRALRLQVQSQERGGLPAAEVTVAQVEAQVEKDPLMQEYERQKQGIEAALEEVRQRAVLGDKEPSLAPHRARLDQVREASQKRRKQIEAFVAEHLRELSKADAKSRQAAQKQRLEYLGRLEELLAKDAERLRNEASQVVRGAIDLIDLQREVDEKEELLRTINKRASALSVELEAPSRVRKIQEAVLRRPRDQVRRLAFTGGTALALMLTSVLGVSLLEYRTRRLGATTEVVDELGMTVLGTLPVYRPGRGGSRDGQGYWERRLVDSVDAARTLLLHIARTAGVKTVMIASAHPGEGKTSLSGQLAASLARAGRRTLLIDADLRKPTVHELFGLALAPGLSEVLRCEAPMSAVIQPTPVPNLFLLAAGHSDESVLRVLATEGPSGTFAGLRQDYDFILVDSSPILPVPDGLMIAQQTDGVLFSVMQRVSRLPSVRAACQRLTMVGARILGAVVSASRDDGAYGYYQYYVPTATRERPPS